MVNLDAAKVRAAMPAGATLEMAGPGRCYVIAPRRKAWAVDPGCHVLMIVGPHPDDVAMGMGWLARGFVDCTAADCEFCDGPGIPGHLAYEDRSG